MDQRKVTRRPTATALVVGAISMLLSCAILAGLGLLLFSWISQMNRTIAGIALWVGALPWVVLWLWLTVTLMECFEKVSGISLRTKSSRSAED
tara:strand:- start:55 stop:333 length:279 start_codon:yes stop_codon:yes gene_type:complete